MPRVVSSHARVRVGAEAVSQLCAGLVASAHKSSFIFELCSKVGLCGEPKVCHSRALRAEQALVPTKAPAQAKVPPPPTLALCVAALQGRLGAELAQLSLPAQPRSDHLTSARGWTPASAARRECAVCSFTRFYPSRWL